MHRPTFMGGGECLDHDRWAEERSPASSETIEARHRLLIRAAEHKSLALTENGWVWINVERDAAIPDLLLLLIGEHDNAEMSVNARRGLFEHPDCACLQDPVGL